MQFPHQVTDYERYLRGYSAELSSGSDEENRAFLDAEAARFAKLQEEIDFYEARCSDFSELQALTAKQRRELKAQPAFEQADAQYRSLRPGELYVHPTAYQRLFGPQGIQNDLWSTALLGLVLSLALSPCFAREQETGVLTLQKTAGALGRATRSKRHLAAGLALSAAIAAYLPQMALIGGTYGLARLYAPAACVLRRARTANLASFCRRVAGKVCPLRRRSANDTGSLQKAAVHGRHDADFHGAFCPVAYIASAFLAAQLLLNRRSPCGQA